MESIPPLFVGRFQPFHRGHLDVIKQILKRHKKVIIGIGSCQYKNLPNNPFSSTLRIKMIKTSLQETKIPRNKFRIVKIPDIHDDTRWVTHVEKLCPPFGDLYSGAPKVQYLFKQNKKHKVIKPKFNLHISATDIRRKMANEKKWAHLVPNAVRKILKKH